MDSEKTKWNLLMYNSTQRFSDRVDNYIKFRPAYPLQILGYLKNEIKFDESFIVADIGSGTGISCRPFLENGNHVIGLEPNKEMREAAERSFSGFANFQSLNATSEQTTIPEKSVDLIVAAQAFHWFDKEKSKNEFKRILKDNGWVLLIWNDRKTDSTIFLKEYEALLQKFGTDYRDVNHKNIDKKVLDLFFGKENYIEKVFENKQLFNFEGLKGRLMSSSYAPSESHPKYLDMIKNLEDIFERYNKDGLVEFEYDTRLFLGRL